MFETVTLPIRILYAMNGRDFCLRQSVRGYASGRARPMIAATAGDEDWLAQAAIVSSLTHYCGGL